MTDTTGEWVWVWEADAGDYYAGRNGALYRDGALAWQGTSCDVGDEIARAILGDRLTVQEAKAPYDPDLGGHFRPLLADTLEPPA